MSTLAHIIAFFAANLIASWLRRDTTAPEDPDRTVATHLLGLAFTLYAMVAALDLADALHPLPLAALSAVVIVGLRREWRRSAEPWLAIGRESSAAVRAFPPLFVITLLPLMMQLATPMQGGDSLVYHLPNTWQFLATRHDGPVIFSPESPSAYYARGMEAIYAFFHGAPLSHASVIVFKWLLFAAVYFLFKARCGNRLISAAVLALLLSMDVIRGDLGCLKNDLPLAIALMVAATGILAPAGTASRVAIAAALALACATKSNALLYAAWLVPLWIWRQPASWRRILLLCALVIVPFGGYFYASNWVVHGSPWFPYGITLAEIHLFPGDTGLFETSLLANLDCDLPLLFLRGLLRQTGPAGLLAIGATAGWLVWAAIPRRGNPARIDAATGLTLALWVLFFAATPLSDHNTPVRHNQLFSGNTVRMALPALLLAAWLITQPLAAWVASRPRRARWLAIGATLAAAVNLFAFDIGAWFIKPAVAFMDIAPLVGSFDNRLLAGVLAGLVLVLIVGAWRARAAVAGLLLVGAVAWYAWRDPAALTHTGRFKQMGTTTDAFRVLSTLTPGLGPFVVHASLPYGYFVGSMNAVLMRDARPVLYARSLAEAPRAALVVACADDVQVDHDARLGKTFGASLAFFDDAPPPPGYQVVYRDAFYVILKPE